MPFPSGKKNNGANQPGTNQTSGRTKKIPSTYSSRNPDPLLFLVRRSTFLRVALNILQERRKTNQKNSDVGTSNPETPERQVDHRKNPNCKYHPPERNGWLSIFSHACGLSVMGPREKWRVDWLRGVDIFP